MITVFGQHGVKDFEAWKRVAQANMSNPQRNAEWGIVESSMYRTVDGSAVIVTHKFSSLETAEKYKAMMESAEAKAMLEQGGAKLPLTLWIAEEI
jgi:hypothetical protein